ncbi:unnamed protein product, partial [Musa hybrid cultivar]
FLFDGSREILVRRLRLTSFDNLFHSSVSTDQIFTNPGRWPGKSCASTICFSACLTLMPLLL